MNPCFATIVSANYLAYATVLRASLATHMPGGQLQVLVVDRPTTAVRDAVARTGLQVTYAADLGVTDFEQVAYKYDVLELNTALKPTFLKRLLGCGFDPVVYLDPDIRLYQAPTVVLDALEDSQVLIIPHTLAPAMDGLRPSDVDFLRVGCYNLGFVGVRAGPHSQAFLDWWERRCLALAFNDFTFGLFSDQKWIDLAPAYFDSVRIFKHRGCNVAYWNLHERQVEATDGQYRVAGQPLVFFHFSGVRAEAPDLLSRHQNRHALVPGTALAGLVSDYCGALLAAGHAEFSRLPYGYGALEDGTPITSTMRRASVCLAQAHDRPFSPASALQQDLREAGITPARSTPAAAAATTLDFDPGQRRVRIVNGLLRLLTRMIGPARVEQMLRYATFLAWQSNFAAVLLDRPFDLRHEDRRAQPPRPSS